eukprot:scaffold249_cov405-Prasinococcus_capsulatus_cf.AAC.3
MPRHGSSVHHVLAGMFIARSCAATNHIPVPVLNFAPYVTRVGWALPCSTSPARRTPLARHTS